MNDVVIMSINISNTDYTRTEKCEDRNEYKSNIHDCNDDCNRINEEKEEDNEEEDNEEVKSQDD